MRQALLSIAVLAPLSLTVIATAASGTSATPPPAPPTLARSTSTADHRDSSSILANSLLVTWYGNPWSERMGILGRLDGDALAAGLKKQAAAYAAVTDK